MREEAMNRYKVVGGVLVIGAGQRVALSRSQFEARVHKLAPAGEGAFVAVEPLQFIAGEELGIDDLSIVQQPFVEAMGVTIEPAQPPKARVSRRT